MPDYNIYLNENGSVLFNSSSVIGSFKFDVEGANIISASGGMAEEFKFLHSALIRPKRPFTIVLGGAKIGTKLPLVARFIREADNVIIGGAMEFTF